MDWKGDNAEGLTFEPLNLTFEHSPLIQFFFGCQHGAGRGSEKDGSSLLRIMCAQVD